MLSETIAFLNDNAAHVEPLITGNIIMLSPHHSYPPITDPVALFWGYLARPKGRSRCSKVTFGNKELSFLADEEDRLTEKLVYRPTHLFLTCLLYSI